jgi:hypothetical protein
MAVRTMLIVVKVAHTDPAVTPTEAEALAVIGADRWDTARGGQRPGNGAYLLSYRTDLGRRGDERDARGAAHVEDTAAKGRPADAGQGGGGGRDTPG